IGAATRMLRFPAFTFVPLPRSDSASTILRNFAAVFASKLSITRTSSPTSSTLTKPSTVFHVEHFSFLSQSFLVPWGYLLRTESPYASANFCAAAGEDHRETYKTARSPVEVGTGFFVVLLKPE